MKRFILGFIALLFLIGGCTVSPLSTSPQEVGLRYTGTNVQLNAEKFVKCQGPSEAEGGDKGDKVYVYPGGQRSWVFAEDENADSKPITVTASNGVTLTVSGAVTFTPKFQDCTKLREFHERIGLKFGAWLKGVDDTTTAKVEGTEGWISMLNVYIKGPIDKATDQAALGYSWQQLVTDPKTKAAWEKSAQDAAGPLVAQQAGGDYFTIDNVFLQAPQIPDEIRAGINAKEQAVLTAEAAAAAQQAANGCDKVCQDYQLNQAIVKAINEGKVQVWPVPVGSPVNPPALR